MTAGGLAGFSNLERLGAGGLGDVFVATRDSTGAKVAIKVLRDWTDSSAAWVRTRREMQALVQLQGHPNVVHVEEVLEVDGVPHIVMEFATGGSVFERLSQAGGRLGLGDIAVIGEHTSAALAAAHQLGILHLDIKPQNLLIGSFGQVKLCDFGIAALTASEEFRQHTNAISPRYASPEQHAEQPVGPMSDVFMLGATLGHLATGILPNQRFGGGADAWATNWPTDPTGAPPVAQRMYQLVSACASYDATKRPTAEECRSAFAALANALLAGRPHVLGDDDATRVQPATRAVHGTPDPTTRAIPTQTAVAEPTRRGLGRHAGAVFAAGFAFVAIAMAVGLWLFRGADGDDAQARRPDDSSAVETAATDPASSDPRETTPTATTAAAPPTAALVVATDPATTIATTTTTTTMAPTTTTTTTVAAPTAPAVAPAALAQTALTAYYEQLRAGDYTAAYAGWVPGVPDPFEVFVDWWAVDIADFSATTHGCADLGTVVECTVEYYLYTSEAARYPNTCQHALFVVSMVPSEGRYLLQGERQSQALSC